MIFLLHTETYELLLDYPKIGGENIKDFAKKAIRNLLRSNMDVHSRRLISAFPVDGIKCIEKCNNIVQTWLLMEKADMTGFSAGNT